MILYVNHTYRLRHVCCPIQSLYTLRSHKMTCIHKIDLKQLQSCAGENAYSPTTPANRLDQNVKRLTVQRTIVHEHTTSIDISYMLNLHALQHVLHNVSLKFMLSPISQRYSHTHTSKCPTTLPTHFSKTTHKANKLFRRSSRTLRALSTPWTRVQSESEQLSTRVLVGPLTFAAALDDHHRNNPKYMQQIDSIV